MQAIVLAGGFGTRLRPLTLYTPKHMLPIVDKPLLEHVLGYLKKAGIIEVWLSIGNEETFMAIKEYFSKKNLGLHIHFIQEPMRMGGAGAIKYALKQSGIKETFVLMLGDDLIEIDLKKLIEFHKKNPALATLALNRIEAPWTCGVVEIKGNNITNFVEKPKQGEEPSNLSSVGLYIMEPEITKYIPDKFLDSIGMLFPILLEKGQKLNGLEDNAFFIDVGRPSSYLEANAYILRKYKKKNWVELGVKLGKGTKLESAVVIQKGTTIGDNCLIKNSVIFKNNKIGDNCRIVDAIIDEGCTLGDNSDVSGIVERNSKING